jgi:hypothetical protein
MVVVEGWPAELQRLVPTVRGGPRTRLKASLSLLESPKRI